WLFTGSNSFWSISTQTERFFSRKSSGRYGHGIKLNQVNFIGGLPLFLMAGWGKHYQLSALRQAQEQESAQTAPHPELVEGGGAATSYGGATKPSSFDELRMR